MDPPVGDSQQVDPALAAAVQSRTGTLRVEVLAALAAARGRDFQRLELVGDSLLEVVVHAHTVLTGPSCPLCRGRADLFTTNAHLQQIAQQTGIGDWLDWQPSRTRRGDLVEACAGGAYVSGRWPQLVWFVARQVHPLAEDEQRRILHGGSQPHPDAPVRAREILGAAILEAAASTAAFARHPEADVGQLARLRARMLSGEHVMARCRDSRWVRRRLRTRHVVRDDVERMLADELLARGVGAAVSLAWPLTT
jgi:hypothetical protein